MPLRHPQFDYRRIAAYFVTICARDRQPLFGRVVDGEMQRSPVGDIVAEERRRSEELRDRFVLNAWVVMPDHVHGIVCLVPSGVDAVSPRGYDVRMHPDLRTPSSAGDGSAARATSRAAEEGRPTPIREPKGPRRQSLSAMIGGFKSAASRRANALRDTPGATLWQRSFHDRILRNEHEWRVRRAYIRKNPERWEHEHNTSV